MIGSIILALIVGAIIGLVARLVMPGKQNIGMVTTVLIGAVMGRRTGIMGRRTGIMGRRTRTRLPW